MAAKPTVSSRAPRGTRTLTQAFFSAADGIPEAQRADVVKAAVMAIRDQLKEEREKAKLTKARAKAKGAKTAGTRRRKVADPAPTEQPVTAPVSKTARAKPGRKPAPKVASDTPETESA